MFETPAISRRQIAPGLHLRFWSCNFSATKIASSIKLPIYFGEQIGIRYFSFWVVSLKWGSKWLQIATHTERRLKIQVSSTAVVKLLLWTYITVRERISTLSSDLQFTSVLTSIILTNVYVYLFPFLLLSEQESLGKSCLFTSLVPIPIFLKDCARTCSADICHLISSKATSELLWHKLAPFLAEKLLGWSV